MAICVFLVVLLSMLSYSAAGDGEDPADIIKEQSQGYRGPKTLLTTSQLKNHLDADLGLEFRSFRLPLTKYKVEDQDRMQMLPGNVIYHQLKLLEYNALERLDFTFHTKIVPYYFDDTWGDLLPGILKIWDLMIADMHRLTCLRFKEIDPNTHTGERIQITMQYGSGCYAVFGRKAHIGRECWWVLFHELGHALHMSELTLASAFGPYADYMMDPGHYLRWSGKNPILDYQVDQRLYNASGQMKHFNLDKLNKMYDCGPDFDRMANGGWSEWSWWTACDTSCKRFRTRFCTADDKRSCAGPNREDQQCPSSECDVNQDGGYAAWTEWFPCSQSCAGGHKFRHRYCLRPIPAVNGSMCPGVVAQFPVANVRRVGMHAERQACNSGPCKYADGTLKYLPVGCYKTNSMLKQELFASYRNSINWSDPVGSVIEPCARGAQLLDRGYVGIEFYGECWTGPDAGVDLSKLSTSNNCNLGLGASLTMFIYKIFPSSDRDGGWAEWSAWSECTANQRSRSRACSNPAKLGNGQPCTGSDSEYEACSSGDALKPRLMSALEPLGCYSRVGKVSLFHNARGKIDWKDFTKTVLECARAAYAKDIKRFGITNWGECRPVSDEDFGAMIDRSHLIAMEYSEVAAMSPYGCFKHMVGIKRDMYVYNLKTTKSIGGSTRPVGWQPWSRWSGCKTFGVCGTQRPPAKVRRFRDCFCWDRAECSSQCSTGKYYEVYPLPCPPNSPCPAFRDRGCWLEEGQVYDSHVIPLLDVKPQHSGNPQDNILACAVAAKAQGYPGFVLKNGGRCASSAHVLRDYGLYGQKLRPDQCPGGVGQVKSQHVYEFTS